MYYYEMCHNTGRQTHWKQGKLLYRYGGFWSKDCTFRFRSGPVPFISSYRSYGGRFRSGLRLQERRRFEEDKQYFPYLTKPDYISIYDDIDKSCYSSNMRTWKRTKVKKQWMRNL